MEDIRPRLSEEEWRADDDPLIEWELARDADEEEVPFEIPRD